MADSPGPATRFHAVEVPSLEGWIAIGRAVGAIPESDRVAFAVLRFILAERLNIAAREMRGLANRDDFEIPVTASGTGLLLVRTGGRPEAVAPLLRFSLDEIGRMHDPDAPVTEAEVARAQGWLVSAVWRRSLELATSASGTFAVEHVRHGGTNHLMEWARDGGIRNARRRKAIGSRVPGPRRLRDRRGRTDGAHQSRPPPALAHRPGRGGGGTRPPLTGSSRSGARPPLVCLSRNRTFPRRG